MHCVWPGICGECSAVLQLVGLASTGGESFQVALYTFRSIFRADYYYYIIIIIINVKHAQKGFSVFNTEVIRSNYLNYILKTI